MFPASSISFFVIIIVIMTTLIPCLQCAAGQDMDPVEVETLFKIMEALSSDQDWRALYPNPCQPGSSWPGIQCRHDTHTHYYHVTRLDFGTSPNPSCKNSAVFPPYIFHLPRLESLFIFQCFTHSPTTISFPESFITASPLQQLSLRANSALLGTIPPQISDLKSLQIVTLSQNSLSGQIPVRVFNLTSLLHLDLSYNLLTGQIPLEVGGLGSLVGLDLSYNHLVGPIPASIGRLGTLQKLDLSFNALTGTIPESFRNLDSLAFLALSSNQLTGTLSFTATTPFGLLQSLQYFLMDDNPVSVSLPVELGQMVKLQEIRLSNSGYWGNIPAEYAQLKNLTTLSLQNNRLSGGIPVGFAGLSHIFHLNLSRNLLDGVVPFNSSFLRRLGRNLDLSGNPGLCLAAADHGIDGVGVCDQGKRSSSIKPLEESKAPFNRITDASFLIIMLLYL